MLCLIDYHEIAGKINPVAFSKYLEDQKIQKDYRKNQTTGGSCRY